MLDLKQLRILAAVAGSGSMTGAATELSYTPSAVSQQMATLERRIGAPLLVRHARGVRLTAVGQLLVQRLDEIDGRLRGLESDVADLINQRTGRLRLGAFASAATSLVPTAIGAFRSQHPQIELTMDILDAQAAVRAVDDGSVDLAVVFDYPDGIRVDTGHLNRRELAKDPMFIALPRHHRLADRSTPIGLDRLRDEQWIWDCGPDPTCSDMLDLLCRQVGFRPTIAFESDNHLAIGRLIDAGVGVAMVPGLAAEQMPDGVRLRPIRPAVSRRIFVLTAAGAPPAAAAMITILRDVCHPIVRSARPRLTRTG